jgi:hypothetical protein
MTKRSPTELSLVKRGVSLHVRSDSVIHIYGKGIIFKGAHATYQSNLRTYTETPPQVRTDSLNNKKIMRAIAIGEAEAKIMELPHMAKRWENLRNSTTVIELDLKTSFLASDPNDGVVRVIHSGRTRGALYISRHYLGSLDLRSDHDMRESLRYG